MKKLVPIFFGGLELFLRFVNLLFKVGIVLVVLDMIYGIYMAFFRA